MVAAAGRAGPGGRGAAGRPGRRLCGRLPARRRTCRAALTVPTLTAAPAAPFSAGGWITVTFQVLVSCPHPLPVQFTLDYDQQGRAAAIRLPGFPDLAQVPYTGCR